MTGHLIYRLRDGTPVLARAYGNGQLLPISYMQLTQAKRKAREVGGVVIGDRPFYVRLTLDGDPNP